MKTNLVRKNNLLVFLVAVCSIALFSAAGIAKEIKKDEPVAQSTGKSKRECRTFKITGSKMQRSICMSKEEWAVADARQKELDEDQERKTNAAFRKIREHSGLSINGDGLDNPNSP